MIRTSQAPKAAPPPVTPEFIRQRMADKMIEISANGNTVDAEALRAAGFTGAEIFDHWEAASDMATLKSRG